MANETDPPLGSLPQKDDESILDLARDAKAFGAEVTVSTSERNRMLGAGTTVNRTIIISYSTHNPEARTL